MRPETGSMQFGEDWSGVFLRGDRAGFYALVLGQHIAALPASSDKHQLAELVNILGSGFQPRADANEEHQKLKPFIQCVCTVPPEEFVLKDCIDCGNSFICDPTETQPRCCNCD